MVSKVSPLILMLKSIITKDMKKPAASTTSSARKSEDSDEEVLFDELFGTDTSDDSDSD